MDECLDWQGRELPRAHPYSFRGFMEREFYGPVDPALAVPEENRHWPRADNVERIAAEAAAAPLDLTYGGWGQDGHIAYNQARRQPYSRLSLEQLALAIAGGNADLLATATDESLGGLLRTLQQENHDQHRVGLPKLSPVVTGDTALCRTAAGLAALHLPDGKLLWDTPLEDALGSLLRDRQRSPQAAQSESFRRAVRGRSGGRHGRAAGTAGGPVGAGLPAAPAHAARRAPAAAGPARARGAPGAG